MIDWNITYRIEAAEKKFGQLTDPVDLSKIVLGPQWKEVREALLREWDNACKEGGYAPDGSFNYGFDVFFGIRLYQLLNEKIGFTNRVACDDNVWRFLSLSVIPDLVVKRYGLKPDHFYKMSKRIWLKSIWWYIKLAWEGNAEDTQELLARNTTDTILQLVERPGLGYYVQVDHEILKRIRDIETSDNSRNVLRAVLKLNTAWLATMSPELYKGGVKGYVDDLFNTACHQNDDQDENARVLNQLFNRSYLSE
jgi:hypothetical protein